MNGNFYQNPTFPTNGIPITEQIPTNPVSQTRETINNYGVISTEQSSIEIILKQNKGKRVNVYASYPDSTEWQNKVYTGIIEQSDNDYLIISDPTNGHWYLIRLNYLDYVEFMESINYK